MYTFNVLELFYNYIPQKSYIQTNMTFECIKNRIKNQKNKQTFWILNMSTSTNYNNIVSLQLVVCSLFSK